MNLSEVQTALADLADPTDAANLARFFKTGPGEYGEGDQFRGIRVPVLRRLVRQARGMAHEDVEKLLQSPFHEDRMVALLIWVEQFKRGDADTREQIVKAYLANSDQINNWDLVDSSAPLILGHYLYEAGRIDNEPLLTELAHSSSLWERRIAMLATFYFIRREAFDEALRIAGLLLQDEHDLIHKAVGWMVREIGERDRAVEEAFLASRYNQMPRTMLRYAIEKFPKERRQAYLKGTA